MEIPDIQEGRYMVCSFLENKECSECEGTLSVYSANTMSLLEADHKRCEDFLMKVFLSHAKNNEYGKQNLSMDPE